MTTSQKWKSHKIKKLKTKISTSFVNLNLAGEVNFAIWFTSGFTSSQQISAADVKLTISKF